MPYHEFVLRDRRLLYELRSDDVMIFDDTSTYGSHEAISWSDIATMATELERKHQRPVTLALLPPERWLARGACGHDIFVRLLLKCFASLGLDTTVVRETFAYAGMPSDWRGGLREGLATLNTMRRNHETQGGSEQNYFAERLTMVIYSVLLSFENGLTWERLVEASAVRILRNLSRQLDSLDSIEEDESGFGLLPG